MLFLRFIQGAGNSFQNIGGYAVPADPRQPLTTPRGFADPAKAAALLEREARRLEDEYDTMHVIWGDVIRLRRGLLDLPGNGLPGTLGAIRTIGTGPFVERQGRRFRAATRSTRCIEFQKNGPPIGEALLGYGNWSRVGSKHVDDQLALASQKKMRPIMRSRAADREEPGEPDDLFRRDGGSDGWRKHHDPDQRDADRDDARGADVEQRRRFLTELAKQKPGPVHDKPGQHRARDGRDLDERTLVGDALRPRQHADRARREAADQQRDRFDVVVVLVPLHDVALVFPGKRHRHGEGQLPDHLNAELKEQNSQECDQVRHR